jgi:prepilin-type N-terminal cleavage/methylation domain-containing protein
MRILLTSRKTQAGFSLVELIIAMTVTLVVLGLAVTLLARALNVRTRSNDNVEALADVERALNIMSREIAQAGFNLQDNGIVAGDSIVDENLNSTIRIRANLNKFDTNATDPARSGIGNPGIQPGEDAGEDVKYYIFPVPANNTSLLARYDRYANGGNGSSTVLANRLDRLHIHYFAQKVTYTTNYGNNVCDIAAPSAAELPNPVGAQYVVIAVCVQQDAVGVPGSPGYQPAGPVLLTSDVTLRNANLTIY